MTEPSSPEIIYNGFLKGEINKEKAVELLVSLIERIEIAEIRVKSLVLLKKINFKKPKLYNILENCLISDENALVRSKAVEVLINNYIDDSFNPVIWALEHDKSPLVIKAIFDHFETITSSRYNIIKKSLADWLEQFSSQIGISPLESIFFLDLEALFAKDKENYEISPQSYKNFKNIGDFKGGEPWLLIKNEHVQILNFNYANWNYIKENIKRIKSLLKLNDLEIYLKTVNKYSLNVNIQELPTSLGKLISLKKLILKRNNLESLPFTIEKLTLLKQLDLSHNNFSKIPEIIGSLRSLEILNLKHNKVRTFPEQLTDFLHSLKKFQM